MAIRSYKGKGTYDVARGITSKDARQILPVNLHGVARRRFAYLAGAESLNDLKARPGLRLHDLKRERKGQFSISINDQYRICFLWNGKDAELVEITDYH